MLWLYLMHLIFYCRVVYDSSIFFITRSLSFKRNFDNSYNFNWYFSSFIWPGFLFYFFFFRAFNYVIIWIDALFDGTLGFSDYSLSTSSGSICMEHSFCDAVTAFNYYIWVLLFLGEHAFTDLIEFAFLVLVFLDSYKSGLLTIWVIFTELYDLDGL